MARQRTTFGKLQREREKQAKAQAKQERRAALAREASEAPPAVSEGMREADEAKLMSALASLQTDLEAGRLSLEQFEARREELLSALQL